MNERQLFSTGDLARAAGVSRMRIKYLREKGQFEAEKVGGIWVVRRAEAQRWLADRGNDPAVLDVP